MSQKDASEGCNGWMQWKDVMEGCHRRMTRKDDTGGCHGRRKIVQGKKRRRGYSVPDKEKRLDNICIKCPSSKSCSDALTIVVLYSCILSV